MSGWHMQIASYHPQCGWRFSLWWFDLGDGSGGAAKNNSCNGLFALKESMLFEQQRGL